MTIQQLQCLCEVVKCESYSIAGENLYVGQSTVSKNISALEREVGFKLIERQGRNSVLTENGRKVMPHIWAIMLASDNLQGVISDIHMFSPNRGRASFKLACIPLVDELSIVNLASSFMNRNAGQVVDLALMEERMAISALMSRDCEMFFGSDVALDMKMVDYRTFCKQTFTIFVPINHPLAPLKQVRLEELQPYRLVLPSRETMLLPLCTNACLEAGFTPKVILTTTRLGIGLGYIYNTDHIYMAMNLPNYVFDSTKFAKLDLIESPTFNYVFAWRKDTPLTAITQLFLDEVCPPE